MIVQDFSTPGLCLSSLIASLPAQSWEEEIVAGAKEEDFVSSPEKMYMLSLRIRGRLPDRLHEAMVMWSFDPSQSDYVKMYLDWTRHCDEMRVSRERLERTLRNHDRILFCMMLFSGFVLLSIFLFGFLK